LGGLLFTLFVQSVFSAPLAEFFQF